MCLDKKYPVVDMDVPDATVIIRRLFERASYFDPLSFRIGLVGEKDE